MATEAMVLELQVVLISQEEKYKHAYTSKYPDPAYVKCLVLLLGP